MSASAPNSSWNSIFGSVGGQGTPYNNQPLSPSNQYYAFLSSADQDETTLLYDILFEVVPVEWMDLAIMAPPVDIDAPPPTSPASLYFINAVDEAAILSALGLKSADYLAEGSWYLLTLVQGTDKVTGMLYDPDIDKTS